MSVVLAALAAAGLMLIQATDESAPVGLPWFAAAIVVIGFVRVFNWWFTAGRTMLPADAERIVLRSRFRSIEVSRADVSGAQIIPGERRPEWSRWAVHPQICLELKGGRKIYRQVLLGQEAIARDSESLRAAIFESAHGGAAHE